MTASLHARICLTLLVLWCACAGRASAAVTVFFDPTQVATPSDSGATWNEVTCAGYRLRYTRDKLFTGGTGSIIGRPVRVQWPAGLEAQYVTTGPTPGKATIRVTRVDGATFDLTSFTAKLLANAGAGRAIEIVPFLGGQEVLPDPLYFDVSGYAGMSFSYDTSPNPWGSTATLTGYDEYAIGLTLDYALTALTLTDASAPLAVGEGGVPRTALRVSPNPARGAVRFTGGDIGRDSRFEVYSVSGARVRTWGAASGGEPVWDLHDDAGRAVAPGLYLVRHLRGVKVVESARVVVTR